MVTDRGERAQLILVASIATALVIIGLTVLVNTVLFTESVGSSSLDNRIAETSEFDSEVVTGVRSLAFRLGHDSRNVTASELRANAARNVTLYGRAVSESYGRSRPAAVSLNYTNASTIGNRTVQDTDMNISDTTGDPDWTLVSDVTVGWFTLNADAGETNTDRTYFNATNASTGRWVNISVNRTLGGNLTVSSNTSFGPRVNATCETVDGRVLLDLYGGGALTDAGPACRYNGTSVINGPYTIDVTDGNNTVGQYSLVTREAVTGRPDCDGLHPSDADPCVAPVFWTVNIETAFEGESINYQNEYNVSIYVDELVDRRVGVLDRADSFVTGPSGAVAGDGGATFDFDLGSADALGSTGDVDGDGESELPYVDNNGDLRVNDSDGEDELVLDRDGGSLSGDEKPDRQKTLMATGTWNGSDRSVLYAGQNHNGIYRVRPGGSPTEIIDTAVNAVLGVGDIDGDGTDELVYAGSSQRVWYAEPGDGSVTDTGFNAGSNQGIGNGPLPDFDDDGTAEALAVGTSNNIHLVDSSGSDVSISVNAEKSPVTASDVDNDGSDEIVFIEKPSPHEVKYVDDVLGTNTVKSVTDADGNPISGDRAIGVVS